MASHVVVVDSSARRATVKTTPTKHLSDVLAEACAKFGVKADLYILKFNNKAVDLSRTIRLANLPQGAKLDLVQGSRSPTAINVALQLESGQRHTQKFASTTPLWQILRIFETTAPDNLNFTQRGIAVTTAAGASSGAGRLNYEIPVINIMGRDLGSLTELQKTLAQLGFTSGSALLRLRFRDSGMPLEEAMAEISQYFQGLEPGSDAETQTADSRGAHAGSAAEVKQEPEQATQPPAVAGESVPPEPAEPMEDALATSDDTTNNNNNNNNNNNDNNDNDTPTAPPPSTSPNDNTTVGPSSRPTLIYSTPTNTTPLAARQPFNATDYIPTAEHARSHQSVLQSQSRNTRLASSAELAAAETARLEKLSAPTASATIRVRLPDQTQVGTTFGALDTGRELYAWVRAMLRFPAASFALKTVAAGGPKALVTLSEGPQRLIRDLGLQGRVLVNLVWGDGVGAEVRGAPSLKDEWREKGREMEVKEPEAVGEAEDGRSGLELGDPKGKRKMSGDDKESKVKTILSKGLFKKK